MRRGEEHESLMSASANDPFHVVKDELVSKLESIEVKVGRFNSLLYGPGTTAGNKDFRERVLRTGEDYLAETEGDSFWSISMTQSQAEQAQLSSAVLVKRINGRKPLKISLARALKNLGGRE